MVLTNKAGKRPVHIVVYDEDFMDFLSNALAFYNLGVSGSLQQVNWLNETDTPEFDILLLDVSLEKDHGQQQLMAIKANPKYRNVRVILLSSSALNHTIVNEVGADGALTIPFELPDLIHKLGGSMEERVAV